MKAPHHCRLHQRVVVLAKTICGARLWLDKSKIDHGMHYIGKQNNIWFCPCLVYFFIQLEHQNVREVDNLQHGMGRLYVVCCYDNSITSTLKRTGNNVVPISPT